MTQKSVVHLASTLCCRPFKRTIVICVNNIQQFSFLHSSYWKKPLTLHELLIEVENIDLEADDQSPIDVVIFPPDTANQDLTDEDSGDEELVNINNLPASQLRGPVEILHTNQDMNNQSESDSDDDVPLSVLCGKSTFGSGGRTDAKHNVTPLTSFVWQEDSALFNFPDFVQPVGPKNNNSPLELFRLFFDMDIMTLLHHHTNNYCRYKNRCADITMDEIQCFIGVLMVSGYVQVPKRYMYWETAEDCHNELIHSAISRDRFTYVIQNIHCSDNNALNANDKFSKVRPLFNALNQRFLMFSPIEENYSIDEAMVPYYGRHPTKQFIRGKPIRWGYKFWVGATRLGYVAWFEPYQGSFSQHVDSYKDMGLGPGVVLRFADVMQQTNPGIHFHFFFDNFFTTLPLLDVLSQRGVKATGTIRDNRLGSCPLSSSKIFKKETRGVFQSSYATSSSANLFVCKWNDNNVVTIASNACTSQPVRQVKRYSRKEKQNILVAQPDIVKSYNANMGGVDRLDQNIGLYRISIRGKKWYFPLICQCIDMAAQNAWQIHRLQGGRMDQLAFRRAVATNILETHRRAPKRGRPRMSSNAHAYSRYDRVDHLIKYQEKQTKCGYCHKKVQFRCRKCDIGLHPKDCFVAYHTQ